MMTSRHTTFPNVENERAVALSGLDFEPVPGFTTALLWNALLFAGLTGCGLLLIRLLGKL